MNRRNIILKCLCCSQMLNTILQLNAIVSDINGCNEIITNGENGWIVPSKNVEQLKEKMIWCLKHPEESKSMGLKSRKLMQEKYECRFVWEELLKEYRRLIKISVHDKK